MTSKKRYIKAYVIYASDKMSYGVNLFREGVY